MNINDFGIFVGKIDAKGRPLATGDLIDVYIFGASILRYKQDTCEFVLELEKREGIFMPLRYIDSSNMTLVRRYNELENFGGDGI